MSTSSLAMSLAPMRAVLAEGAAHGPAIPPIFVGVGTLAIFVVMLAGLLMFGKGRDHS